MQRDLGLLIRTLIAEVRGRGGSQRAFVNDCHFLHVRRLQHADVSDHLALQLFQLKCMGPLLSLDVSLYLPQ